MIPSRRLRLGLLLILWGVLASACDRTPSLPPLAPGSTILAFGDSLTRGTGAPDEQSYPARLSSLIGYPVVNAGIPGELSSEGRERLPGLLDRNRPALLLLCHGGNDLLRRHDDVATAENIRAMVRTARQRGIPVVLVGVPRPGLILSPAEFYREIAAEFALPLAEEVVSEILSARELKSDAVHPNARGYAVLARRLAELLQEAGAV